MGSGYITTNYEAIRALENEYEAPLNQEAEACQHNGDETYYRRKSRRAFTYKDYLPEQEETL